MAAADNAPIVTVRSRAEQRAWLATFRKPCPDLLAAEGWIDSPHPR